MNDKIENSLKEEQEDGEYLHTLGGGQSSPEDLRDPLSCETDMKMKKSENSSHPFDLLLIKLEEGCQKNKDQKSHMTEEHSRYGADRLSCFPEQVETNQ